MPAARPPTPSRRKAAPGRAAVAAVASAHTANAVASSRLTFLIIRSPQHSPPPPANLPSPHTYPIISTSNNCTISRGFGVNHPVRCGGKLLFAAAADDFLQPVDFGVPALPAGEIVGGEKFPVAAGGHHHKPVAFVRRQAEAFVIPAQASMTENPVRRFPVIFRGIAANALHLFRAESAQGGA